jgi:hypothetical protein
MERRFSYNLSSTTELQNVSKLFSICLKVDQDEIMSYQLKFVV